MPLPRNKPIREIEKVRAKIIEKTWNKNQDKIKDAIWFFERYVLEAKPYINNIKEILKKG